MASDRNSSQRQRKRQQGLRPLEVWLPEPMIERIDALKGAGENREAVIAKLIATTLEGRRPPEPASQFQLAI